jgi:hypothetical protein
MNCSQYGRLLSRLGCDDGCEHNLGKCVLGLDIGECSGESPKLTNIERRRPLKLYPSKPVDATERTDCLGIEKICMAVLASPLKRYIFV